MNENEFANVALAAAYATVDKTFKEYRNRVVERFGAEVDKELRYNIKAKKFEETVTDPDSGKEKKVKSTVDVAAPSTNDYARFFDDTCGAYESNMDYNLMYLRSQQNLANDKVSIDATEQAKLIATNIREGVTILGVEGAMSGSEDMKPQSKEVTPSKEAQTIMPDEEYNCLSQVTVKAIPYVETDNSAGGKTVTIG